MVSVARAHIKKRVGGDAYEAVAVDLDSHHEAVSKIVDSIFVGSQLTKLVALRHDRYKPTTMRVETTNKGELRLGFRGHPYMLSFIDLEDLLKSPRDVAIATAIGRLHHFINVRDVDSFVHTIALAKSYLDSRGVYVSLSELKKEVLRGLLALHIADMISGFIEHTLITRLPTPETYDTDSLEDVEPHLPLSITLDVIGRPVARVRIHGLPELLKPALLNNHLHLEVQYRVFEGFLKRGGRAFEEQWCDEQRVSVVFAHKRMLLERKLRSVAGGSP